ARL
ncbi:hypothetical protein BN1723_020638, partial [Verticillium longisporum]